MGYVLLAVLLAFTAFLVAIEMAVFSTRRERLRAWADEGDRRAVVVLSYLRNPPRLIASLQIYSTLLSVLVGALTQSLFSNPILKFLEERGWSDQYAPTIAFWTGVVIMTVLSLLIANLLPKQIGFAFADPVAVKTASISKFLAWLVRPFAVGLEKVTQGMARALRVPLEGQPYVNESELRMLLREGVSKGDLNRRESEIVDRALKMSDIRVTDVMTPRDQISFLDINKPIKTMLEEADNNAHAFMPVCDSTLEKCLGIIRARQLFSPKFKKTPEAVRELLTPTLTVPKTAKLLDILELLQNNPARMALVHGDNAYVLGVVTLNDVVTALVGPLEALRA